MLSKQHWIMICCKNTENIEVLMIPLRSRLFYSSECGVVPSEKSLSKRQNREVRPGRSLNSLCKRLFYGYLKAASLPCKLRGRGPAQLGAIWLKNSLRSGHRASSGFRKLHKGFIKTAQSTSARHIRQRSEATCRVCSW